jgi:hypothetical protein
MENIKLGHNIISIANEGDIKELEQSLLSSDVDKEEVDIIINAYKMAIQDLSTYIIMHN